MLSTFIATIYGKIWAPSSLKAARKVQNTKSELFDVLYRKARLRKRLKPHSVSEPTRRNVAQNLSRKNGAHEVRGEIRLRDRRTCVRHSRGFSAALARLLKTKIVDQWLVLEQSSSASSHAGEHTSLLPDKARVSILAWQLPHVLGSCTKRGEDTVGPFYESDPHRQDLESKLRLPEASLTKLLTTSPYVRTLNAACHMAPPSSAALKIQPNERFDKTICNWVVFETISNSFRDTIATPATETWQ